LLIARDGHHIVTVADGESAITAVQSNVFDVILMDINMPVMDGFEATARIRALGGRIHQPRIVALTASVSAADRRRAAEAGMDGYLSKPIRMAELSAAIVGFRGVATALQTDQDIDSLTMEVLGPEVVAELMTALAASTRADLDEISAAAEAKDLDGVRFAAHRLRGGCSAFGLAGLAGFTAGIEERAASGVLPTATELRDLSKECDTAIEALGLRIGSRGARMALSQASRA
jgi:CheY-like chemotaxis protein